MDKCDNCSFWNENELGEWECEFPWFDPTPEAILRKACADDDVEGDGDTEPWFSEEDVD